MTSPRRPTWWRRGTSQPSGADSSPAVVRPPCRRCESTWTTALHRWPLNEYTPLEHALADSRRPHQPVGPRRLLSLHDVGGMEWKRANGVRLAADLGTRPRRGQPTHLLQPVTTDRSRLTGPG